MPVARLGKRLPWVSTPGEALDLCNAFVARQADLLAAYGEWFLRRQLAGE